MMLAIFFIAILVGLIRPDFVANRKAFGVSVILVVVEFVVKAAGATTSWFWVQALKALMDSGATWPPHTAMFLIMMTAPVFEIALAISLLLAYWPGGKLFAVGRRAEEDAAEP